jgi:hypothetical protein
MHPYCPEHQQLMDYLQQLDDDWRGIEATHLAVYGESEESASAAMRRVQSLAGFTFEIRDRPLTRTAFCCDAVGSPSFPAEAENCDRSVRAADIGSERVENPHEA